MLDSQTRILLSVYSHAFLPVDGACYVFDRIMQQIDHYEEETMSVGDIIEEKYYIPFNEWSSVSIANHIVGDDKQLLAKF